MMNEIKLRRRVMNLERLVSVSAAYVDTVRAPLDQIDILLERAYFIEMQTEIGRAH